MSFRPAALAIWIGCAAALPAPGRAQDSAAAPAPGAAAQRDLERGKVIQFCQQVDATATPTV